MGLAANQARLLTLTSRMHDLELQCMRYSNEKIVNSMIASNISITYNQMLTEANNIDCSNAWKLTGKTITNSSTSGETVTIPFNYHSLTSYGYSIEPSEQFKSSNGIGGTNGTNGSNGTNGTNGTNGVNNGFDINTELSEDNMPTTMKDLENLLKKAGILGAISESNFAKFKSDGTIYGDNEPKPQIDASYWLNESVHVGNGDTKPAGTSVSIKELAKYLVKDQSTIKGNSGYANQSGYVEYSDYANTKLEFDYNKLVEMLGGSPSSAGGENNGNGGTGNVDNAAGQEDNSSAWDELLKKIKEKSEELEQAIIRGDVVVKDPSGNPIGYSATVNVQVSNGTKGSSTQEIWEIDTRERDKKRDEAEDYYRTETAKLTSAEKILDMKSKMADTQYQACCTEYESVKSLIDENADRAFSIFG